MLATLNAKQIVDEIVKDTVKDNDPHDAIQISPDMVLACLLYTSPSPRDRTRSRMPSSA